MTKKIIRLCYRKVIDATSEQVWDKYVFESSYTEFLMQAQLYNQEKKYTSYSELLLHVPAAEKLSFLVSAAVVGYMQQLGNKIPDITDNLGRQFLQFNNYRFEIIQSDIKKKPLHRIAVNFFSEPLVWHETMGNQLLLSPAGAPETADGTLTHVLLLPPFLSIHSLKEASA